MTPDAPLFKILSHAAWTDADGIVPWAPVDVKDGFVHLSAAHQVRETAARHFADRDDLVLVEVLPEALRPGTLRWEVSRGGDRFPHVYGDIPIGAVGRTATFSTCAGAAFPEALLVPRVPNEGLAGKLADVGYRFRRALRDPEVLERTGLAPFQARALAFVGRFPGARQQRFVEGSGRDKGQVARVFQDLERRGLVVRRPDPKDGRAACLHLTSEGEEVAAVLLDHRKRVSARMFATLSEAEARQLGSLLDRVLDGLSG